MGSLPCWSLEMNILNSLSIKTYFPSMDDNHVTKFSSSEEAPDFYWSSSPHPQNHTDNVLNTDPGSSLSQWLFCKMPKNKLTSHTMAFTQGKFFHVYFNIWRGTRDVNKTCFYDQVFLWSIVLVSCSKKTVARTAPVSLTHSKLGVKIMLTTLIPNPIL